MKGMNFKKAFLLSGILLLSVFVVIQLSWGCDDDDKWDRDCHDKWHWDHDCWPCNPPKIQRVFLDHKPDPDTLIEFWIWGKNFDKGASPVVTLGGKFDLSVTKYLDEYIIATLPMSEEKEFKFGDYRLVVSTCHDSSCIYKYCKDYCFKCKDKHCRDYCSKCKDRHCKDKYWKDHENECKCKDRYSLTIADPEGQKGQPGPPGPAGPPGVSGYERILVNYSAVELPPGTSTTSAACPEGKRLLGGGGGVTKSHGPLLATRPAMIYNGPDQDGGEEWSIIWFNGREVNLDKVDISVYAICADVSQ